MAENTKQQQQEALTPAWDPNPLVVVSRRTRNLVFPAAVLQREPTKEDMIKWYGPTSKAEDRDDKIVTVQAGITFLGTLTTAWTLKEITKSSDAPKDDKGRPLAPAPQTTLQVSPENTARNIFALPMFRDKATQALLCGEVSKAWMRVFKHLQARDEDLVLAGQLGLFTTSGGFDAPEIMLLPLRDVLEHKTDLGQQGFGMTLNAIPTHRNATHLGALHDHACHYPQSWQIVEAARRRVQVWRNSEA